MGTIFADVRFLRGPEENLPTLAEGQPAFTEDTKRVFIGSDQGNVELAKQEHVDAIDTELNNARGELPALGDRLDAVDEQLAEKVTKTDVGNLADLTTADKSSLVNAINSNTASLAGKAQQEELGSITDLNWLPASAVQAIKDLLNWQLQNAINIQTPPYNAKCDGITDDTIAFQNALNAGNVIVPRNANIKLGAINIPNNGRIIDFNGATITAISGTLFQTGDLTVNSYFGYFTLKNAVIEPKVAGTLFNLIDCINVRIENIRIPHVLDNSICFNIVNGFNWEFDRVWAGNGNAAKAVNSYCIKVTCASSAKVGVNNITNTSIRNCLIQNIANGVYVDPTNGSIDTLTFENDGFSTCDTAVYILGPSTGSKIISLKNTRVENSTIGIRNNGMTTIEDFHCYNTTTALQNDGNGRLKTLGNLNFNLSSGQYAIVNNGFGLFEDSWVAYNPGVLFTLNAHTRPWNPLVTTNSTRTFTIDPIFNTTIYQTAYFEFTDLPTTGVANGTEIMIYSTGNWNPLVATGIYYNGFKYGALRLKFLGGKWLIIGDSTVAGS